MQKKIDTHVHAWNIEKVEYDWLKGNASILNRTYSLDELEPALLASEVGFGVMVQSANNLEDTIAMIHECSTRDWLKGMVGWLPLMQPELVEERLLFHSSEFMKGIRHLINDEPNPKWLLQKPVTESFSKLEKARLSFDVVAVLPEHLECILRLSEKFPDIFWCIDHLGNPPVKTNERFGKWGVLMKELSKNPKIFIKISGLGMTTKNLSNWNPDEIQPFIEFGLEWFGTHRAMMGGDWPMVELCGGYTKSWQAYEQILSKNLSTSELDFIFYQNAIGFYKLIV